MVQPLLAQLVRLSTGPTQLGLAILDNLVKYTAPAFIFGILYTTIRTHSGAGVFNYRHYLRHILDQRLLTFITQAPTRATLP